MKEWKEGKEGKEKVTIVISCNRFVSSDPSLTSKNWIICKNCGKDIFNHNVHCPICKRGLQLDTSAVSYTHLRAHET